MTRIKASVGIFPGACECMRSVVYSGRIRDNDRHNCLIAFIHGQKRIRNSDILRVKSCVSQSSSFPGLFSSVDVSKRHFFTCPHEKYQCQAARNATSLLQQSLGVVLRAGLESSGR